VIYAVLAVVVILIGAVDIAPLVDWVDARNFPIGLKSTIMLGILGGIPALIIGVAIVGDTFWNRDRR